MTEPVAIAAVDLGATSGRVMLAHVTPTSIELEQVARFPNGPVRTPDGLHWNLLGLYEHVLAGLREALRRAPVRSIGIDSWAVDYALLRDGRMLGEPFHYRDARTAAGVEAVHAVVPPEELYRANGLQHLPFNTVFQLATERLDDVDAALLVPDLLAYWLTGRQVAERTNASTTGLLDPSTGAWNTALLARLGLPPRILPPLVDPGDTIGELLPHVADEIGGSPRVVAVGSHDTASAVVAVPAASPHFAYISCGTWGLVGVELAAPVLSEAGRAANFTNEGGVDGTVRYLHNVMGLWLLTESVREWERDGRPVDLPGLLAAAAEYRGPVALFDANDPEFLAPGAMATRIAEHCHARGIDAPTSRAGWARSIVESLAAAFAEAIRTASDLSGRRVDTIHLVGGGSQNQLLCRLTAQRSGLPVVAGPVEATAIGNVLVQARALGVLDGDLSALRSVVAASVATRRFEP